MVYRDRIRVPPLRGHIGRRAGDHGGGQPRATEAGGRSIGLNIKLPYAQGANRYITPGLQFEFHYFLHTEGLVRLSREIAGRVPRGACLASSA